MRLLLFLCLLAQGVCGQNLQLANKSALKADRFIGIDSYRHVYFIKNGALHKQGELGTFAFQDFQLGPVSSVDIINPLNVVVFYAEMNTVVFLDNRLNEKERINFNDLPSFLNVSFVTNAGNNRLWIFNSDTQQLELYHYRNQQQTLVSQPLKGKVLKQVSDFNECTLLSEHTLRKINSYGSLLYEIPLEGFSKITSYQEKLMGVKENQLFWIDKAAVQPLTVTLNEKPIKDLQLTQEFLYIYDGETLFTFSLTQPKQ
ncbi:MAG TPA: hypothetical protein PKW08_07475 [Flavobacteriaceae bacterium]|nr:hypothetical protein [Flavobacteriaceae bacterium]MCB9212361.1 hypothetical protein [Alteromonas sp.]HPF12007.1 hypothetical protein [Flavobacteriaceae bacterium]HQU21414.1 hypothetical protein [Flavobacteriaceae bacterium]HQU65158.1 hypothetical protein [Flavobacteriaceae bacterium]